MAPGPGRVFYYVFLVLTCWHCAASASSYGVVTHLPGFNGPLPFHLETGYVGVGEKEEAQLFYYFVKSEGNPVEDPVVLWLTGGPGCSALSGLVYEIGPMNFEIVEYNGSLPSLVLNPDSWTQVASIIFVDMPVGTGFSYATTIEASQSSDFLQIQHAYEFLRKWLIDHPEFITNPVYIGGDSFSGLIVPGVVANISDGNEEGKVPFINLKGYLLGNAATDSLFETNFEIPYAYGHAIISYELYQSLKRNCGGNYKIHDPNNSACLANMKAYNETYGYLLSKYWANDKFVQTALHIKEIFRTVDDHLYLSGKGYRSLVYSGDHDMMVTYLGTQAWIRALNFSIVDDWRSWHVENQVAGYTRTYSNKMTFATVKGGGHTAPEYKPHECFAMFTRWISGEPL
ncbi:unnamed protein product [Linum tenue]|uniref:Uncharacterized protein n=1 Tax=Linum tenue TaxID=586396 RepID=A0AAV0P057_9ROSI|nr:unnamed protein product [Linum tenue]